MLRERSDQKIFGFYPNLWNSGYISRKLSKMSNKFVWGKKAVCGGGELHPVPLPSYVPAAKQQCQLLLMCNAAGAEDTAVKPLTVEQVRGEKQALKLLRRQLKELDSLRRRHTKERSDIQRQLCATFDKQLQQHERERLQAERAKKKSALRFNRSLNLYRTAKCPSIISITPFNYLGYSCFPGVLWCSASRHM